MNVLGISCYYHDSAACLYQGDRPVAAAHEERFTRKKHDQDFPTHAIEYCLQEGGIEKSDLDAVVFYDKPLRKFERILLTYLATFPRGYSSFLRAMPLWVKDKIFIPKKIQNSLGYKKSILFAQHHQSHAASAFLVSPFERAAIVTVDGVGEWTTSAIGRGEGNQVSLLKETRFPHSLGLLYTAFTYFLGFKVNSAEYKVMGLAPYGEPRFADKIREHLIDLKSDGSFRLDMKYFNYHRGLTMTGKKFERMLGVPRRRAEDSLDQVHKDLAASVQEVTEDAVLAMVRHAHEITGERALCMAGGVALNCVANGRVVREGPFDELFVQPAAGDAGGSLGAAAFAVHSVLGVPRNYVMEHAYLGPSYSDDQVRTVLDGYGVPYEELEKEELVRRTAQAVGDQKIIGWFQGRMEFGPRALGSRSILADPRNPENQNRVNLAIKFRESFRPFAPVVLEERASEYFELDRPSPFMLLVSQVRPDRRTIPSVTHVDGSARIQTVSREHNGIYYDLIEEFDRQTGCPILINTSFNVRGEPIVCTPDDAFRCFMRTHMNVLVMGSFYVEKENMPPVGQLLGDLEEFELD